MPHFRLPCVIELLSFKADCIRGKKPEEGQKLSLGPAPVLAWYNVGQVVTWAQKPGLSSLEESCRPISQTHSGDQAPLCVREKGQPEGRLFITNTGEQPCPFSSGIMPCPLLRSLCADGFIAWKRRLFWYSKLCYWNTNAVSRELSFQGKPQIHLELTWWLPNLIQP